MKLSRSIVTALVALSVAGPGVGPAVAGDSVERASAASSTGYALVGSGVLLAFVPNEIGRALLHSARHERRAQ